MQLFSVDQQRSQALEAHAASFAQFKVTSLFFGEFIYGLILNCSLTCNTINIRFLGMRILLFLYHLQARALMLGR